MRAGSVIAGSLGITLVGGGLLLATLAGVAMLLAFAPQRDPGLVREALLDARGDLELCAAGQPDGDLRLTLALHRGQATHVAIDDATVSEPVANCIAEAMVTRPWPAISGAATVPIHLVH